MAKVEKELTMLRFTKRVPGALYAYEEIEVTETVAPENLAMRIAEIRGLLDSELAEGSVVTKLKYVEPDADGVVEISLDGDDEAEELVEKHEEVYSELKEKIEAKKEEAPAPKKRGRKPKAAAPAPAPVVPEPEDAEDTDDETDILGEEPEVEEAPKAKKLKKANTPYDRESAFHRKLVSEILAAHVPNWKKDPNKVKLASKQMHAVDMIDGDGEMLPEFKDKFVKAVKAK